MDDQAMFEPDPPRKPGECCVGEKGQIHRRDVDPRAFYSLAAARENLIFSKGKHLSSLELDHIQSHIAASEMITFSNKVHSVKHTAVPMAISMQQRGEAVSVEQTDAMLSFLISEVAKEVTIIQKHQPTIRSRPMETTELKLRAIERVAWRLQSGQPEIDNSMLHQKLALRLLEDFANNVKAESAATRPLGLWGLIPSGNI